MVRSPPTPPFGPERVEVLPPTELPAPLPPLPPLPVKVPALLLAPLDPHWMLEAPTRNDATAARARLRCRRRDDAMADLGEPGRPDGNIISAARERRAPRMQRGAF